MRPAPRAVDGSVCSWGCPSPTCPPTTGPASPPGRFMTSTSRGWPSYAAPSTANYCRPTTMRWPSSGRRSLSRICPPWSAARTGTAPMRKPPPAAMRRGHGLAVERPKAPVVGEVDEGSLYALKRRTVTIRHATNDRIVALLEIVSRATRTAPSRWGGLWTRRFRPAVGLSHGRGGLIPARPQRPFGPGRRGVGGDRRPGCRLAGGKAAVGGVVPRRRPDTVLRRGRSRRARRCRSCRCFTTRTGTSSSHWRRPTPPPTRASRAGGSG